MKLKNKKLFYQQKFTNNKFEVLNPSNQKLIGEVESLDIKQVRAVIDLAHDGFLKWKEFTGKERAKILRNWYELIIENKDDLGVILTSEQGKPILEGVGEVVYGANFVEWFCEESKRVLGDVILAPKANQKIITQKEPVGVVAAITPWNFPSAMITRKAAAAMAAGCCVILKPSELTPFSAIALGVLAKEAGIPDGVFNVITGDANLIGEEFCRNKKVRKISFTGSTRVGKLLAKNCGDDLKRLSLELGGSAPFIIFADANLDLAITGLIHAKFRNGGQACTCVNRIFVEEKIHDKFLTKFKKEVKKLKVGDGFKKDTNIGPMINKEAITKVERLINDAIKQGAKCEFGGKKIKKLFFEPTILTKVTQKMDVANEEIFGAVAAIQTFKSEKELIKKANNTDYGLGSYFYTQNANRIWKIADQLQFGMVAINECSFATEVAPFGGVKHSGYGLEGSHLGIEEFLQNKTFHISY